MYNPQVIKKVTGTSKLKSLTKKLKGVGKKILKSKGTRWDE